eukprot:TRINITY_DN6558_c0_g1_i1.p1 TRINITY_DN6558_c0_g1~~TRINITY_DN6558_c0_g1_i1.p1  ORF type:complete len:766 (-),score=146.33 TRINITY_DN6558_c0_g1_i1:23-2320(-)
MAFNRTGTPIVPILREARAAEASSTAVHGVFRLSQGGYQTPLSARSPRKDRPSSASRANGTPAAGNVRVSAPKAGPSSSAAKGGSADGASSRAISPGKAGERATSPSQSRAQSPRQRQRAVGTDSASSSRPASASATPRRPRSSSGRSSVSSLTGPAAVRQAALRLAARGSSSGPSKDLLPKAGDSPGAVSAIVGGGPPGETVEELSVRIHQLEGQLGVACEQVRSRLMNRGAPSPAASGGRPDMRRTESTGSSRRTAPARRQISAGELPSPLRKDEPRTENEAELLSPTESVSGWQLSGRELELWQHNQELLAERRALSSRLREICVACGLQVSETDAVGPQVFADAIGGALLERMQSEREMQGLCRAVESQLRETQTRLWESRAQCSLLQSELQEAKASMRHEAVRADQDAVAEAGSRTTTAGSTAGSHFGDQQLSCMEDDAFPSRCQVSPPAQDRPMGLGCSYLLLQEETPAFGGRQQEAVETPAFGGRQQGAAFASEPTQEELAWALTKTVEMTPPSSAPSSAHDPVKVHEQGEHPPAVEEGQPRRPSGDAHRQMSESELGSVADALAQELTSSRRQSFCEDSGSAPPAAQARRPEVDSSPDLCDGYALRCDEDFSQGAAGGGGGFPIPVLRTPEISAPGPFLVSDEGDGLDDIGGRAAQPPFDEANCGAADTGDGVTRQVSDFEVRLGDSPPRRESASSLAGGLGELMSKKQSEMSALKARSDEAGLSQEEQDALLATLGAAQEELRLLREYAGLDLAPN